MFEDNSDDNEKLYQELHHLSNVIIKDIEKSLDSIDQKYTWAFNGFKILDANTIEEYGDEVEELPLDNNITETDPMYKRGILHSLENIELSDIILCNSIYIYRKELIKDTFHRDAHNIKDWVGKREINFNQIKSIVDKISPKHYVSYVDYNSRDRDHHPKNSFLLSFQYDCSGLSNKINDLYKNMNK